MIDHDTLLDYLFDLLETEEKLAVEKQLRSCRESRELLQLLRKKFTCLSLVDSQYAPKRNWTPIVASAALLLVTGVLLSLTWLSDVKKQTQLAKENNIQFIELTEDKMTVKKFSLSTKFEDSLQEINFPKILPRESTSYSIAPKITGPKTITLARTVPFLDLLSDYQKLQLGTANFQLLTGGKNKELTQEHFNQGERGELTQI